MKIETIVWSIAFTLLGTGAAAAYHIMLPVGPSATDNMATQWENSGNAATVCENQGPDDKIFALPVKSRGYGGLCYASSWHPGTKGIDPPPASGDPKKTEPRYDSSDINNTAVTEWSRITPTCSPLPEIINPANNAIAPANPAPLCPGGTLGPVFGTWFARAGNNAHGCIGTWGQSYYYAEAMAYWLGVGPNTPFGFPSGHVTFFIDDPLTAGSYTFTQDISQATLDAARLGGVPSPSFHAWCF